MLLAHWWSGFAGAFQLILGGDREGGKGKVRCEMQHGKRGCFKKNLVCIFVPLYYDILHLRTPVLLTKCYPAVLFRASDHFWKWLISILMIAPWNKSYSFLGDSPFLGLLPRVCSMDSHSTSRWVWWHCFGILLKPKKKKKDKRHALFHSAGKENRCPKRRASVRCHPWQGRWRSVGRWARGIWNSARKASERWTPGSAHLRNAVTSQNA